ncbi:hypothetical protein TWF281_002726 [Arthrobotrys megalospora]
MYRDHLEKRDLIRQFDSPGVKGTNRIVDPNCGGGLYDIYLRRDHLFFGEDAKPIIGRFKRGKIWHGSPTATALHTAKVLGCPGPTDDWIEPDKFSMLSELIALWKMEPPPPTTPGHGLSNREDEDVEGVSFIRSVKEHNRRPMVSVIARNWQWGPQLTSDDAARFFSQVM